jgi:hypothetical protein
VAACRSGRDARAGGEGGGAKARGRCRVEAAAAYGLPVRVSELNSLYHWGQRGASDAFVAAVWAADVCFEFLAAGAAGVNFHGALGRCGARKLDRTWADEAVTRAVIAGGTAGLWSMDGRV